MTTILYTFGSELSDIIKNIEEPNNEYKLRFSKKRKLTKHTYIIEKHAMIFETDHDDIFLDIDNKISLS
jgi:hypothetical protein